MLIGYDPAFLCDGGSIERVLVVAPEDAIGWAGAVIPRLSVTFTFNIDIEGRPLGISRTGAGQPFYGETADLAPALAATRFAAGQARKGCTAVFTPKQVTIASAPVEQLARYAAMPHSVRVPAIWTALKPANSTCTNRPRPRTIRYPDFTGLTETPGLPDYIALYYDVDAAGIPQNIRTITSSANAEFDRRAIDSIARSEFVPGAPVTGCLSSFAKGPRASMVPPAIPENRSLQPGVACRNEPKWVSKPPLVFPRNFSRRAIEGWAIIGFDVAPWGGTGNVRVLASEPAAEFGDAALRIIQGAKKPESDRGLSGCTERVRFVIQRNVTITDPENM